MPKEKKISLKLLGAYDSVTGSKTLLSHGSKNYLIDCGLFQGSPELRQRNREPLEIPAHTIDAVFLTHAHLDHCGYLPRLYQDGFRGPVYCSQGTFQLAEVILKDAAHLEEELASYARSSRYSHHPDPQPLFTLDDVGSVLEQFRVVKRHEWHQIDDTMSLFLSRSGHLIGSSFIQLKFQIDQNPKTITFSGDLGNDRSSTLKGPEAIDENNTLVLESTYGNRLHSAESALSQLGDSLATVVARKGVAIIPAFAVGRSQEIIYLIAELERTRKIPSVPVFLDSPMAEKALAIFLQRHEDQILRSGFGPSAQEYFPKKFQIIQSVDESMLATMMDGPAVIISASGMLSGGRVLHHLKRRLPDPKNMVIFSGYQAEGSKGRYLQEQAALSGTLRIHHQDVAVAAEIRTIDTLSSHADFQETTKWLQNNRSRPQRIILNHGSIEAQRHLARILQESFACEIIVSSEQREWDL